MDYAQHARFWSKVKVKDSHECWVWKAGNSQGYGRFMWPKSSKFNGGKLCSAHRVAYEMAYGAIPDKKIVLHKCDNPKCVNPKHLSIGTHQDNYDDMISKGRGIHQVHNDVMPSGTEHYNAKLTELDVLDIYKMKKNGISASEIAMIKGVSKINIYTILQGKSWKKLWLKHYKV